MSTRFRALGLFVTTVSGCFSPEYGPAPFACPKASRCPEGYRCIEGICSSGALYHDSGAADRWWRDVGLADGPPGSDARDGALSPDRGVTAPGTWVKVDPGVFGMGSPPSEPCREAEGETLHQVTLTRAFEIQTTEVTQGQFEKVLEYNPSGFPSCGADCPVEQVSWYEAAAYCNALSATNGLARCYACTGSKSAVSCSVDAGFQGGEIYGCPGFRLPTEAEWEYAYRAGTQTALYSGAISECKGVDPNTQTIGWYGENSASRTHRVGRKQANDWLLHDMAGNVWEWCHDRWQADLGPATATDPWGAASGGLFVKRGGSWRHAAKYLRAAYRTEDTPVWIENVNGFRCVRTLTP